jgi:LAGLIDADG-like domain
MSSMDMTWAYIAGFFDGEGCLHAIGPGGAGRDSFRITISQTQDIGKQTLEEIAEFLNQRGIAAYVLKHHRNKKPEHQHWRQCYNLWITQRVSIASFIEGVFPYLRIKKQRAEDYRRTSIMTPKLSGRHELSETVHADGHVTTAPWTNGFPKLRRADFCKLLDENVPIAEIARRHGLDYSSVWLRAKRWGYKVDSITESNRKRAKVSIEQLTEAYKEVGSYQAVARKYGDRAWNVRRRLIAAGLDVNPPGKTRGRHAVRQLVSGNV